MDEDKTSILKVLLSQLLQDKNQAIDYTAWIEQFSQHRRIYNALYDFAETIYDCETAQINENLSQFQDTPLFEILNHGRKPMYLKVDDKNHIAMDDLLNQSVFDFNEQQAQDILVDLSDTIPIEKNLTPTVKKMPHFQMPNARVGQNYQAKVIMKYPVEQDIIIQADSIKIPEDLGVLFDAEQQQFEGIPTKAGDFVIHFQYKKHQDSTESKSGEVTFIITADPRSLWQMNEPDKTLPYQKSHSDTKLITAEDFNLIATSQRGRSHEHAGTFRDDDFYIHRVADTNWSILIVADGAGSAAFSREGSRIVVNTVGDYLTDYLQDESQTLDELLAQWQIGSDDDTTKSMRQQIYNRFHDKFYKAAQLAIDAIEQEAIQQNVAAKTFATTLLVAVVRQQNNTTFINSFWMGDGAIAVYGQDKVRLMGKPDGGEFAGQTRFLDRSFAHQFSQRVNIGYFDDSQAVILMTDGISDPRFETDAGLENQQKWHDLWQDIEPQLKHEQPEHALLEWSKFFSKGHHDDRSLAVLWTVSTSSTNGSGTVTESIEVIEAGEQHE